MNYIALTILIDRFYKHGDTPVAEHIPTSAAKIEALNMLSKEGLVETHDETCDVSITEKGRFHVRTLMKHPLPVVTYTYEAKNNESQ